MFEPESIDEMTAHARAEYPAECCGIVVGSGRNQRVHRCRNLQDELHAGDPAAHPRTSREAFAIDRRELDRIVKEAAAEGQTVTAFYHSHIDCGAYFSAMDREVQTVFGEPEFPDALHLVIAVHEGEVRDICGFFWDRQQQDFVGQTIKP